MHSASSVVGPRFLSSIKYRPFGKGSAAQWGLGWDGQDFPAGHKQGVLVQKKKIAMKCEPLKYLPFSSHLK